MATKGEIKKKLTSLYKLRKELRENITNTKAALEDCNKVIELLTSQLEEMEKESKKNEKSLYN